MSQKCLRRCKDDAGRLVDELTPRNFTEFFVSKQTPKRMITLRKYTLPMEVEHIYLQLIRRAKKGKADGPDGIPMKLLQICPPAFAEILLDIFAAVARLKCVMKNWDFPFSSPS